MKKEQTNTEIINDMDGELKVLAKTFVEAAIKKGYNATKIYKLTQEVWRECNGGIHPKVELQEENLDEKEFREKAQTLLKYIPNIETCNNEISYVEKGEVKKTNAALEMLCVMYKIFKSEADTQPKREYVEELTKERLIAISNYSPYSEVRRASRTIRIFASFIADNFYWEGFKDFSSQYACQRKSVAEEILAIVWYVNNRL